MMKRLLAVLALATMAPMQAHALLGFGVEVGYAQWMQDNSGSIAGTPVAASSATPGIIWAEVEHPVPLVPNLRYSSSDISIGNASNGLNLQFNDIVLYYNLWDTLATVDVGFGVRNMSGSAVVASVLNNVPGAPVPVIFTNLAAKIPVVGLTVGTRYTGISLGDSSVTSTELYANYEIVAGLGITAGMRNDSVNFSVTDGAIAADSSGAFIGVMYKLD